MKILVYSHDANTRAQVRLALGRRPAPGLPQVEYVEIATEPAVFARLDQGDIDVAVLDGEAQPAGGMGICRQAKDEIYNCPPIMVLIARRDDGWLATWSRADAVASQPVDAVALAEGVAELMRRRAESGTGTELSRQ
jgi:DNA-binding response OmpR family regulator